jgi:hypothetical protein
LNLFYEYGYSVSNLEASVTSHPYHIYAKIPDL